MTRLLICDDHELVRSAIARALQSADPRLVVMHAGNAKALLAFVKEHAAPDLLLLDLNLGIGGVAATLTLLERLSREHPRMKVVVLSAHDEPETVDRALRAGARGFVSKSSTLEVLQQALVTVRAGERFIDSALVSDLLALRETPTGAWDATLSPRERDVMARLCSGQRLQAIAAALGLSVKTVSTHKMRLMAKLGLANNAELIRLGHANGLV